MMTKGNFFRRLLLGFAALSTTSLIISGFAAPAEAATAIQFPTSYNFSPQILIDGNYYDTSSTVGNGGHLILETSVGGYYYQGHKVAAHISLQRKVGSGAWKTVKKNIKPRSDGKIQTATPAYSTGSQKATATYRFVSKKYKTTKGRGVPHTAYSPKAKIVYENQKAYTGLTKDLYQAVKAYCPATAVHVGSSGTYEAGKFYTGAIVINVESYVSEYTPGERAAIALHECAHERQFINYGETMTGWAKMKKAMPKYFKNDATPAGVEPQPGGDSEGGAFSSVEHAADCASFSVDPAGYLGYGGYCNPSELAAGKKLLTGKRL
jgi:cytidine deaminase